MPYRTTVIIYPILYNMAKSKNKMVNRTKTNNNKAKAIITRPMTVRQPGIHQQYKRLLLDPCNAELIKSPYGGDAGATVIRRHGVFNNNFDSQMVFYHPVLGAYWNAAAAGTNGNLVPVNGFAQISSGTASRALAGCLEVMYTGAENARSGMVHCAVVPGAIVWNYLNASAGGAGGVIDAVVAASYFQNISRMPVDRCSVNWYPTNADAEWIPPMFLNAAQTGAIEKIFAATHFAVIFVAGGGVNNVRFSATGVVETSSTAGGGTGTSLDVVPWAVQSSTTEPVNVQRVIKELATVDPRWYLDTFRKAYRFGAGLVSSVMRGGLPGALGYLATEASSLVVGGTKGRFVASGN